MYFYFVSKNSIIFYVVYLQLSISQNFTQILTRVKINIFLIVNTKSPVKFLFRLLFWYLKYPQGHHKFGQLVLGTS